MDESNPFVPWSSSGILLEDAARRRSNGIEYASSATAWEIDWGIDEDSVSKGEEEDITAETYVISPFIYILGHAGFQYRKAISGTLTT